MEVCKKSFSARIDCRIYQAISIRASDEGKSMTEIMEDMARKYFGRNIPGTCKDCGKLNEIDSKFCSQCGKELKQ